MKFRTYVRVRI